MFFNALAFLLGICILQTLASLPFILYILPAAAIMAGWYWHKRIIIFRWFCLLLLGMAYVDWYAASILAQRLPSHLEGQPITIVGFINDLPHASQVSFHIQKLNQKPENRNVRLFWNKPPQALHVGQVWQLQVKLKRIHSLYNPDTFDAERFALFKQIHASGYVIQQTHPQLINQQVYLAPLAFMREQVFLQLQTILPKTATAHWLSALIMGERVGVQPVEWAILRRTGTNHLMAIAGLHIGFVFSCAYKLIVWLLRLFPRLLLVCPAQQIALGVATLFATAYSALAGLSLPTQRACIMLLLATLVYMYKCVLSRWDILGATLLLVLLLNPLQVLTESFWLSFVTLVLILYGMQHRLQPTGLFWRWGRLQWLISIGLLPLSWLFFNEGALYGFIANSFSVPWLLLTILPLALLATICLPIVPFVSEQLFTLADLSLNGLWQALTWLAHLPYATFSIPVHGVYLMCAILSIILLFLPKGLPGRALSAIWLLPLFLQPITRPALGEIWFYVFDVGHGLATLVQTQNHALVYDTGARYANSDMGERIVVPVLQSLHIKQINGLIISHNDNDHVGGKQAVLNAFPNTPNITCADGKQWRWDNISFRLMQAKLSRQTKNNQSCLLKISNGKQAMLLSGDIERKAEQELVKRYGKQLSAAILVAPHHGSATSSSRSFIQTVKPNYVIFPVGYHNRYHLPNNKVLQRYGNAILLQTDQTGMLSFNIPFTGPLQFKKYRQIKPYYWLSNNT